MLLLHDYPTRGLINIIFFKMWLYSHCSKYTCRNKNLESLHLQLYLKKTYMYYIKIRHWYKNWIRSIDGSRSLFSLLRLLDHESIENHGFHIVMPTCMYREEHKEKRTVKLYNRDLLSGLPIRLDTYIHAHCWCTHLRTRARSWTLDSCSTRFFLTLWFGVPFPGSRPWTLPTRRASLVLSTRILWFLILWFLSAYSRHSSTESNM